MQVTKLENNKYYISFENEKEYDKFITFMNEDQKSFMKAKEVMSTLDITRQTLCHYVKKGLISVVKNPAGKQYLYDRASVMEVLKKFDKRSN